MYIRKICNKNTRPIERVLIKSKISGDGLSTPLLTVRNNGTGKSSLISNLEGRSK